MTATGVDVLVAVGEGVAVRDADTPLVVDALAAAGVSARPAIWSDRSERWDEVRLVVVRSTWDYVGRLADFLSWAASVPRLANPADVLAWNTDKGYLRDLEAAGIPVVPTSWVDAGEVAELPAGEIVVKPVVSNGARDTARYGPADRGAALAHVARLHAAGRAAMVQPYVASVDTVGEIGVVVLGGEVSHAIAKGARLVEPGGRVLGGSEGVVAATAAPEERELAARVLETVPGGADRLLYARVDMVRGPGGDPMLMELEVTEPSLFLGLDDDAAARLASAVVRVLGQTGRAVDRN